VQTAADGQVLAVLPGPGRERMPFRGVRDNGHWYVFLADAQPLVATGRIDRGLFDVTALIGYGCDDAHRADVPVLISDAKTVTRAAAPKLPDGVKAGRALPGLGLAAGCSKPRRAVPGWST
jgi:hypothetical protein